MKTKIFCLFGKKIKNKLVEIDQSQKWLIEEVRRDTGLFFDTSYLYKVMMGTIATPSIVTSICKILNIEREEE